MQNFDEIMLNLGATKLPIKGDDTGTFYYWDLKPSRKINLTFERFRKMSIAPNNKTPKRWYITPNGKFRCLREVAEAYEISATTAMNRFKKLDDWEIKDEILSG